MIQGLALHVWGGTAWPSGVFWLALITSLGWILLHRLCIWRWLVPQAPEAPGTQEEQS